MRLPRRRGTPGMRRARAALPAVIMAAAWSLLAATDLGAASSDVALPGVHLFPGLSPIDIGSWRIEPLRIAAALGLFVLLLVATRLSRRALASTMLGPGRIDASVAHSIDKALGYAGVALATVAAVSVAGFDITSVAILAGALSVGIGFGLQSIVSNFVSGLILLAERPVKVGDWIEAKGLRGRVMRVSVRATEMRTADGASVFLPNSDLIANAVVNLTPDGPRGETAVRVTLAHATDPLAAQRVLGECAAASGVLLAVPPARVSFDDIGANGLVFTVRGQVADLPGVAAAETALRTAVAMAIQRAGLEIARPQADVHLRDLDAVRAIVTRVLAERERRAAEAVGAETPRG